MIRKPPAGWQREEGAGVRTIRTVARSASSGVTAVSGSATDGPIVPWGLNSASGTGARGPGGGRGG